MNSSISGLCDLAGYQARKLGLKLTPAQVGIMLDRLVNDKSLIRYRLPPHFENVVMTVGGREVVVNWSPGRVQIENFSAPHPKGVITPAALRYALNGGMPVDQEFLARVIAALEKFSTEKTLGEGSLVSGSVIVDGDKFDVTIDGHRRIVRFSRHVLRYATAHAIQRAKQRYDLPLTYDVAEEMVSLMKSGQFVKNEPAPGDDRETIRGTIHYDMEDFTIVYNPSQEKIVTVTPLGDYDRKRHLRGE